MRGQERAGPKENGTWYTYRHYIELIDGARKPFQTPGVLKSTGNFHYTLC